MNSQLDTIWDMTPETYAHRQEIRRRNASRAKRQDRLYPVLWAVGVFVWVLVCLWVGLG
jgi:Flp pilus assembly protein TadB